MKQMIVVKVSMTDLKSRAKAMKIAVGVSGVESAAITGNDKNQVEVVGDGVDAVVLTRLLRKNVAHAELVSVGEAKKEAAAPPKAVVPDPQPPVVWTYVPPPPHYNSCYHEYEAREPYCTIL